MIDHKTKPVFQLQLWGDWGTIISAFREDRYRDVLLDQKPDSPDDADYGCFTLPFDDMPELFALLQLASDKHVRCEIAVDIKSAETGVEAWAATGSGWSNKSEPASTVRVKLKEIDAKRTAAIKQVREILAGLDE